jgi:hypothetical protein
MFCGANVFSISAQYDPRKKNGFLYKKDVKSRPEFI